MRGVYRPKIQRLVTPLRLQRRRHLRSLKIRRLEHQKEQKAEYECVLTLFFFLKPMSGLFSALIAKRIAEKKEKVAAIKASHKKCVYLYLNISSAARLTFYSQDCISAGSCLSGFALHCTFSCSLGSCGAIYSCPVTFMSHTSLTRFYTSDTRQDYLHIIHVQASTLVITSSSTG